MKSSDGHGPGRKERVRCAIYTRKSSEEGLEQEFNSLQAQREACEAFIISQRHEGWVCLASQGCRHTSLGRLVLVRAARCLLSLRGGLSGGVAES